MNETQLIIAMYNNNIGINRIAKITNKTSLDIFNCLRDNGIKRPDEKHMLRDKDICDQFLNGARIIDIAANLNVDRHVVSNVLDENKIKRIKRNASNLSVEKQNRNNKIISLYLEGNSLSQVGKKVNMAACSIAKILKDLNIERRSQHQKGHSAGVSRNRKHIFNLDYFSVIDTEEKAYWLGFLYADGYVGYRGVITLGLQKRDLCHIRAFKKAIGSNDLDINYNNKTKSYSMTVCSVKMANDLINLGCVQKKSLVLKFPTVNQVDSKFINHFMRGYFDGDGCIHTNKDCATFSVLGTKDFLDVYEEMLLKHCNNKKKNKRSHQDTWNINTEQISYSGKRVKDIYNFLYKDATIFLERKKEKFNTFYSRLKTKTTQKS